MKSRNRGMVLSYLYSGMNMVSGLILSVFLLRVLGDTEYGIYQTIAAFANYLVLLEFGTGTAMTRNISLCRGRNASKDEIQGNITTVWMISLVLGAVITLVAVIFCINIDSIYSTTLTPDQLIYGKKIFVLATIHLVASFLAQTVSGIILAYEHYAFSSIVGVIRIALRTCLLVSLIFFYRSAIIIAAVDAIFSVLLLMTAVVYSVRHFGIHLKPGKIDFQIFQLTIPLCLALFLQAIINQANNNVDKFLIGVMMSPESVALYSVAIFVFSTFSALTTIPISLYAPMINMTIQQDSSMEHLFPKLISPCRMVAVIGGMVYLGFISIGRSFVDLFYGAEYTDAWVIAIILMTPMYFNMVVGVLVNVLDALNKRLVRSLLLLFTTVSNIILTIFWLRHWGIVGAAWATAICTFVGQVVLMNLYYRKKMKINIFKLYCCAFKGSLPCLLAACIATMAVNALMPNGILSFVISVFVFVVVFAMLYFCFGIQDSEKKIIKSFLKRG